MSSRHLLRILGLLFLGVGAAGVFLPLLPTTPWVLLAAACFARTSPRMHRWVLANPTFGPMIRDWENNRCIRRRVKLFAIFSMVLVGGASIILALDSWAWRWAGVLLMLAGILAISALRTCKEKAG
ncbi:MAG: YbaN family protein [Xanthomonadales bacterium]|nr:YbaN family protein [Xanthomonadales bacterium]